MKAKEYTFDASYQPQVRTNTDTSRIMLDVIIALVPAMVVGIVMFGVKALLLIAVSVASAVFWEWGYRKLMKKPNSLGDLCRHLLRNCGCYAAVWRHRQELRQPCTRRPCVHVLLLDLRHDQVGSA